MNPKLDAAKQHLHKYRQALLRIIGDITNRPIQAPSIFALTVSYTATWEEVGALALMVWELSALEHARFDAHPQWEAAANETIRFLSEHCAGCGCRLIASTGRLCHACLTTLDAPTRYALHASEVVRQIEAYLAELNASAVTENETDDT
ncbi:MAG: hypothetical protein NZ585_11185 [Chloracidobacterium sp.]|nr:hypothetical protein [Chloracidobacterium sp.]MDW8218184.1 hypothetical protein [Acidobacteriota bacterium]